MHEMFTGRYYDKTRDEKLLRHKERAQAADNRFTVECSFSSIENGIENRF